MQPEVMVPQNTLAKLVNIKAQIRGLEKSGKKTHFQAKLKQLQAEVILEFFMQAEFLTEKKIASFIKAKQFTLEQAKYIHIFNVYKSKYQCYFNHFLMQINNIFKAESIIYMSNKNKCQFADSLCNKTSCTD